MTQATEAQATAPIQVGEFRDFLTGTGHAVTVVRDAADVYRVMVLDLRGLAVTCYTTTFDAAQGNLPVGTSSKRAAWEYIQFLVADFGGTVEQPADVAARVTVDALVASDAKRLSDAQRRAINSADAEGVVHRGHGVTEATVRSLAKSHLGDLTYTARGLRKIVAGVRLNRQGRRLHAVLTAQTITLAA